MAVSAPRALPPTIQRSFFCPCGRPFETRRGLCRVCAAAQAYSQRSFGGHRAAVLARDGYRCQSCGAGNWLNVHHRRPGRHDPQWLVTLCAGCHARVHRLRALHHWLPETILGLWEEQHPETPRQLQLALGDRS